MRKQAIDFSAVEQVILRELQRQGVEFARVRTREHFGLSETHIIVEVFTEQQLDPRYVEAMRISNQLDNSPEQDPDSNFTNCYVGLYVNGL